MAASVQIVHVVHRRLFRGCRSAMCESGTSKPQLAAFPTDGSPLMYSMDDMDCMDYGRATRSVPCPVCSGSG